MLYQAKKLENVDPRLQVIVEAIAKEIDVIVVCGYRGQKEQDDAYRKGLSKAKFPKSMHNKSPSQAVDLAILDKDKTINWRNIDNFKKLNTMIETEAKRINCKILWGGYFKSLADYCHWELVL